MKFLAMWAKRNTKQKLTYIAVRHADEDGARPHLHVLLHLPGPQLRGAFRQADATVMLGSKSQNEDAGRLSMVGACIDCGGEVSSTAAFCPHCGSTSDVHIPPRRSPRERKADEALGNVSSPLFIAGGVGGLLVGAYGAIEEATRLHYTPIGFIFVLALYGGILGTIGLVAGLIVIMTIRQGIVLGASLIPIFVAAAFAIYAYKMGLIGAFIYWLFHGTQTAFGDPAIFQI